MPASRSASRNGWDTGAKLMETDSPTGWRRPVEADGVVRVAGDELVRWSIDIRFEATRGSKPLSKEEESGYDAFQRYIRKHQHVPLRIRGKEGPESWPDWHARCLNMVKAAA